MESDSKTRTPNDQKGQRKEYTTLQQIAAQIEQMVQILS